MYGIIYDRKSRDTAAPFRPEHSVDIQPGEGPMVGRFL